ncbi:hypothetical protein RFI_18538 [Reticulomyxa filosa]|uniref:Uncharacterized protein n=1 Tax=Reticulomyxa filosa TaxID=46433 RepID=X6N068_RETFI|nr:hypothetical protein RFI_18538 [Reticulomyxa filosa]|eukprot:ETO18717.1 hypothetical protein RFI_18538 [Reticulomyxa filosa]
MLNKKVLSIALVLFCGLSIPLVGAQSCYVDETCKDGMLGCNANSNLTCRYCGSGSYVNITCPEKLSNCCKSAGGQVSCYVDKTCKDGMLGCNANSNLTCRYCGSGSYVNITCPEKLSDCCKSTGGEVSCYVDETCKKGMLGCDANNNLTCRYCGGSSTYASITCPEKLSNCCKHTCPYTIPFKKVRTLKLRNYCSFDLYVGVIGTNGTNSTNGKPWGPRHGGFQLPAGSEDEIHISGPWSGRIWPRTNCRQNASLNSFQCDSGGCASSDNNNGINGTCCGDTLGQFFFFFEVRIRNFFFFFLKKKKRKCTSSQQTSLAEFFIAGNTTESDTYDMSLVDGYTIPMSVIPYENDTNCGSNSSYYCKEANINEFDVASHCPPELRWSGTGAYSNTPFCSSICKAVKSKEMISKSSILSNWANDASAVGASGTNYTSTYTLFQAQKDECSFSTYNNIQNNFFFFFFFYFLCCQCSAANDRCDNSTSCSFGCSPHPNNNKYWPANRTCVVISGTGIPDWPYSPSSGFETVNYARMFKSNSPTAYSWQVFIYLFFFKFYKRMKGGGGHLARLCNNLLNMFCGILFCNCNILLYVCVCYDWDEQHSLENKKIYFQV